MRPKVASSAPTSPRNTAPVESRELVDRLLSQVEALKSEVRKLTEAQQQPAHAIAAIEAEQESQPSVARALVLRPRCAVVRVGEPTGAVGRRAASATASEPTSYIALGAAAHSREPASGLFILRQCSDRPERLRPSP